MRLKPNKMQSKLSSKRRIGLISIKHFQTQFMYRVNSAMRKIGGNEIIRKQKKKQKMTTCLFLAKGKKE